MIDINKLVVSPPPEDAASEILSVVPIKILSVGQGDEADTLRLEVEIHRSLAEWLGKIGARFFPIYGEIEERLKRQRDTAKRKARTAARLELVEKAGRHAFRRIRKEGREHEKLIFVESALRFGLTANDWKGVKVWKNLYWAEFRKRLALRRKREALRYHRQGLSKSEIADRLGVTPSRIYRILSESRAVAL